LPLVCCTGVLMVVVCDIAVWCRVRQRDLSCRSHTSVHCMHSLLRISTLLHSQRLFHHWMNTSDLYELYFVFLHFYNNCFVSIVTENMMFVIE